MPVLRRKFQYSKVWRPDGTLYSSAKKMGLKEAIDRATYLFVEEFGRMPDQERTIYEVVGVTGAWDASIFELPSE